MNWLTAALISCTFWATGDVLGVTVSRRMNGPSVTTWATVFGLIAFAPYVFLHLGLLSGMTWLVAARIFVLGAIGLAGNVCFSEGLAFQMRRRQWVRIGATLAGIVALGFISR